MSKYYAENITPILIEIEDHMWEVDARKEVEPYEFSLEALRAASKIMMSVMMSHLWDKQEKENLDIKTREQQARNLGIQFRKLLMDNLNIDSTEFYKKERLNESL